MIAMGAYYKTLKGDVGRCMVATSLNYSLKDDFAFDEQVTLCQLFFDNGKNEFWLSTQIEEVSSPHINLFEEREAE